MYLIDTNVVSELRKPRPNARIVQWLENIDDKDLFLSSVTVGEIQAGIEITREQDPSKAVALETWAEQVATNYNVLPMDGRCFRRWAKLMHRQSDTVHEYAMIAATAIEHDLAVVTRNTKDFTRFKVRVLDPFKS